MNTFKKLLSRQCYRTIPFWLILLIALYSAFGFLLLPKLIHNAISDQVNSHLGWQTEISKVTVNPFLMTLNIENLAISEAQNNTLSFSRFHADFELRSLIEGAFTFKNVELVDPSFNLSINQDGSTNIGQAIAANALPVTEAENNNDTPLVLPKLLFDNISVKNGSLLANDHSQGSLIKHQLNPISFQLNAFSTYVKQGGEYQLHISLGDQQSIDWSGQVSVAPLSSQGAFAIKGFKAHRFWAYLEKQSPYTLLDSNTDIKANYVVSYVDDNLQLQFSDALLTLNDVKLAYKENTQVFSTINQIKIGPTQFDLQQKNVAIEKVSIDNFSLNLLRNNQGQLPLLLAMEPYLAKNEPITTAAATTVTEPEFLWSVDKISVGNSQVNISDNAVAGGATVKIHNIEAELLSLNQSLSNKQPFSVAYQIDTSSTNKLSGELVANPLTVNSKITIAKIPLTIIQPYLGEVANVRINSGLLSAQGDVTLATHHQQGLTGNFDGSLDISDFDSRDTLIKRRLVGWQALSISPVKVNLSPLAIDIKKITLNEPYSRLIISEDRNINFAQLMKNAKKSQTKTEQQPKVNSNPPKIDIAEIHIKQGSAYFADLSLRPQFATSIDNMNGFIKGLSSNNLESANVDIKGTVEEFGKMAVEGKINPLSGDLYSDINVNFDKIELTTLTPYSGRYAGYVIDKGKLSLALNYKISKGMLDGSNRLILDQFELGDSVESEESLDLPIKLALALFKDSDGIIDISLPTKGDMNSPDFEIGGLVFKALMNVMTKAISSPFTLLANLAGGEEQDLQAISFELGSSNLSQEQQAKLATLSSLLIKRPQLILEMRVFVDSELESEKLKQQALITQLEFVKKTIPQQIAAMETHLGEMQDKQAVANIKEQLIEQQQEQLDSAEFDKQYHYQLFKQLVTIQPLESLALTELAQKRISVIKTALITDNKVDNEQVFALQPSLTGSAENTIIKTIFSLTSK